MSEQNTEAILIPSEVRFDTTPRVVTQEAIDANVERLRETNKQWYAQFVENPSSLKTTELAKEADLTIHELGWQRTELERQSQKRQGWLRRLVG